MTALTAAATTPPLVWPDATPEAPPPDVPPGYTVDRVVTDYSGPIPSTLTVAHRFRALEPGDEGYVPEPKPGEKGYEP